MGKLGDGATKYIRDDVPVIYEIRYVFFFVDDHMFEKKINRILDLTKVSVTHLEFAMGQKVRALTVLVLQTGSGSLA